MPKNKKEPLRPLVIVVINGGNYQDSYKGRGVGVPIVKVIDWDNIRSGEKPDLDERDFRLISRANKENAEELRRAMKDCDPDCPVRSNPLAECNCSRLRD